MLPLELKMHVLTLAVLEKERVEKKNGDGSGNDGGMVVDEFNRFGDAIAIQSMIKREAYDQVNSCPVCMCELFAEPNFSSTAVPQLADQ